MPRQHTDRYPVEGFPAGLLSWYAPNGRAVALVTFWVAFIGGTVPRLRAAWPGRRDPRSLFWAGGDFVLNLLEDRDFEKVRRMVNVGSLCFDVADDLGVSVASAETIDAPLLQQCPVQVECCGGRVSVETVEPEVTGEVNVLHKRGQTIEPADLSLDVLKPFDMGGKV